jgi:hypothetical protein
MRSNFSRAPVVTFLVASLVCLTVVVSAITASNSQVPAAPAEAVLPPLPLVQHPADSAEVIKNTYEFAARHPEVLRYMPCFCICGTSVNHRSSEDCFIAARGKRGTVVWNEHAAECVICLSVAREARDMFLSGASVGAIREHIEATFGAKYKNRTNTSLPPNPHGVGLH